MNDTLRILFGLFGGLAIFIYGMNLMSECLQKAAGEKMRTILSLLTKNPVMGVLAGALATTVLQSSSATTVMAIGFVSAGLMTLPQAISIIFGANIGTTITAQIIAFKISDYIFAFIFIGFLIGFISKSQKVKNIGQSIFGFGLLFLGIETMGDVMKPLATSPIFVNLIETVADIPVLGVILGTIMTLVVQSSSATIAVLQNFASQPGPDGVTSIIGLAGAIPILLGDNVGTTITAVLASIGQKKDAKRTALAHCLFNLSGCLLFIWIIKPYASVIQAISPKGAEVDVISRQIANAHTGFNIVMTLIWIPLIWLMVKIVMKLIPEKEEKYIANPSTPQFLDEKLINQPSVALHLVSREIVRCGSMLGNALGTLEKSVSEDEHVILPDAIEEAGHVHNLNEEINNYLAAMFSEGAMTEEQGAKAGGLMYVMCDIDRIAVLCKEISINIEENGNKKTKYSKDAMKDIKKAVALITKMYNNVMKYADDAEAIDTEKISANKLKMIKLEERLRKGHRERVEKGKCDAMLTTSFHALIHCLDRMGNSCLNLAETVSERQEFDAFFQGEILQTAE